jgi:hypothetical protein
LLILRAIAKLHDCWYNLFARIAEPWSRIQQFNTSILITHLTNPQEEFMKFGSSVVGMVLFSMVAFCGQPAWSQDTTQEGTPREATQMEVQPSPADEAQPAATGVGQPAAAGETQATVPGETQPVAPSQTQPAAPSEPQTAIRIPEAVVCQDVVDRAPVGAGDVFAKEIPRVYCFTHVAGADPGTQLVHNWYYQGNLKATVNLTVGSSDFRTWSYKTMMPQWTGEWKVEILTAGGTPLENIIFVLK